MFHHLRSNFFYYSANGSGLKRFMIYLNIFFML